MPVGGETATITAMFSSACRSKLAVIPVASSMPKLSGARSAIRSPR